MHRTAPSPSWLRTAESGAVVAVQQRLRAPWAVRGAQGLSAFGDHAAGWLALGVLGAAVDGERRSAWVRAGAGVLGAHAATVVIKRVLRRARPSTHALDAAGLAPGEPPRITVHATTPGRLSFPSSHAASSTAAALAYGRILGGRGGQVGALAAVTPVMGLSRLVLGLHFPTDVAVGAAVGALAGRWARPPRGPASSGGPASPSGRASSRGSGRRTS